MNRLLGRREQPHTSPKRKRGSSLGATGKRSDGSDSTSVKTGLTQDRVTVHELESASIGINPEK